MLTRLLPAIRAERPGLSLLSCALIDALCLAGGNLGPSDAVARALGLRNRFDLARLLAREGLPPLRRIAAWATVLAWIRRTERDNMSLCEIALRSGRYPGACYRQVKDVTGVSWEVVKALGAEWLQREFLAALARRDPKTEEPHNRLATATRP